jgi:hypothetical protein
MFYSPVGRVLDTPYEKTDGIWSDLCRTRLALPAHIKRIDDDGLWYPWQRGILSTLAIDKTARKVNVLVDSRGNCGKSTVGVFAACKGLAQRIPQLSNHTELMQFVHSLPVSPAYFFDIPRQIGVHGAGMMWSAIEEIKNGVSFDKRYHGRMRFFEPPNVWVFTNDFPNVATLSIDRWRFWRIINNKLIACRPSGEPLLMNEMSQECLELCSQIARDEQAMEELHQGAEDLAVPVTREPSPEVDPDERGSSLEVPNAPNPPRKRRRKN